MPYEYELDETEKNIIETHRTKKLYRQRKLSVKLKILEIAYRWEKWLQDNGAGSTYSTFCDDFGFGTNQVPELERRSVYELVDHVRKHVRKGVIINRFET